MALHIALDGVNGVGKTTMIEKLKEFLVNKSYNVKTLTQPGFNPIVSILKDYNLTISEKELLLAVDRSITFNSENLDQYDVVLWDRSILTSYAYHTDGTVKPSFIRNINRFTPEMDIIIVITHYEYTQEQDFTNRVCYDLIRKYDVLIEEFSNAFEVKYLADDPDKMLENIVEIIFSELPTCSWCGRLFRKSVSNKKYCSDNCKKFAKEEQNRDNFRNYYNRYKDTMSESKKGALGSKGANLHGKANKDPEVEARLINREKMRLGL